MKTKKSPAATCSPAASRGSTIGAGGLDFRVRDGNGYGTPAIATGRLNPGFAVRACGPDP